MDDLIEIEDDEVDDIFEAQGTRYKEKFNEFALQCTGRPASYATLRLKHGFAAIAACPQFAVIDNSIDSEVRLRDDLLSEYCCLCLNGPCLCCVRTRRNPSPILGHSLDSPVRVQNNVRHVHVEAVSKGDTAEVRFFLISVPSHIFVHLSHNHWSQGKYQIGGGAWRCIKYITTGI